jgi:hypothetical protein
MALTTIQPYNINTVATFSFTDVAATDVSATGNVEATGNVSGDYFIGNGSSLTHLNGANVTGEVDYAATANSVAGSNVSGEVDYAAVANSVAVANVSGIGNIATINLDGNAGNILYGNGVFSSAPNVENANTANYASVANSITGSNVSGEVSFANTANSVAGANVSGAVAYATTANSVAGANVSGAVGLATYATTANSVAGANVSGQVNFAATANSVAGANVSGQVSYAAVANSVSVANVSGIGNIAVLNLDGNSGNILYGNGSFATAPNAEYSNIANTAGTVTTNAQPNITSVGTLTILTSTGNITGGNLVTAGSANVGSGISVSGGGASIIGAVGITGDINVTGNFNVSGNLNYQNVTDLVVGDPLIYLAANGVGDTDDIGIVGNYNDGAYRHTGLARDHSDDIWKFFTDLAPEPTTVIDWANASYPTVKVGNLLSANLTGTGWANITGNVTAGNANLGNAVTANYFVGSGANLSSIAGANVTGAVSYATTANSVAGANVSGAVSYATTANSVAGANVSGAVGLATYATTANSVAGANVSGAVSYATTANSVAGANVSGAVSYATTANSVAGANVSGTVGSATTAGTVTTAAQPNITSTGTLSSVNSSGNVTAPNVVANTGAFYGSGAGLSSIPAGNLTGTIDNARVNGQTYTINITGSAGTASTVTTAAQPNITSVGTLSSVSVSGTSTLPQILVNRSSGAGTGISWYSSSYSAWTDYMSSAGATGCGPFGNITAPSGNLVTNWGLRSFIEDASGYGWTWESGSAQQTTPTIKAEIRSSDGSFRNTGNIYCVGDVITNYSDVNLKDIIGPIENAVEKVCAIETFYYRPNQIAKDLGVADELQVGVSAQSVKRVAEETTRPSPINDKYLTVMYERLVPYLIESIKEHEKTIQDLKEQINSLKGK